MKLRYVAKTTENGYSFVFRNVLEFKYLADKKFLSVQLHGKRLDLHGVTSFEGGGDFEPWGDDYAMIPPEDGGESVKRDENPIHCDVCTCGFTDIDKIYHEIQETHSITKYSKEKSDALIVRLNKFVECQRMRVDAVPVDLDSTTFAPLEWLSYPYSKSINGIREAKGLSRIPHSISVEAHH